MKENLFEKKWLSLTPLLILIGFLIIYVFAQNGFIESNLNFSNEECTARKKNNEQADCARVEPTYIFSTATEPFDQAGNLVKDEKQSDTQSRAKIAERYNGRLLAMFMIAANVLFGLIAFSIFFFLIERLQGYKWAFGLIAVSILFGFILSFTDRMPLMEPILRNTIGSLWGGMAGIFDVIRLVNSIAYGATLAFVFAICVNLYPEKNGSAVSGDANEKKAPEKIDSQDDAMKKLQDLADKKANLETLLYIGTVLLIVGVLRMTAMGNWSLAFMTPETAKIANTFFAHLTTVIGGFFTLLLATAYIPAIYILQQRHQVLLDRYAENGIDTAKEAEKTDFIFSMKDALPKIIAIIAPFLTGPIAELFKNLIPK
jgi:hypothetical protein